MDFSRFKKKNSQRAITAVAVLIAAVISWRLWVHYENDPWTRDGRVNANVILVAPDVTGQVVKMNVQDNQQVRAGDTLFEIDATRFELALSRALAYQKVATVSLNQAIREAKRNEELKSLISTEEYEQGKARVDQAQANLAQATVNAKTAKLDVKRSKVVAGVNGAVTNLDLQNGTYVTKGSPVMALVDQDSFYVEGYFEETKLPNIHVGNKAIITLMGDGNTLEGYVDSISGGIDDRERTTGSKLLKKVNPAFNWVRLVQRVPVRIALKEIPENVHLVAGLTATIEVLEEQFESDKAGK